MVLVILANILLAYIKIENVKGGMLEKDVMMIFGFNLYPRTIMWLLKSQIIYIFTIFIGSLSKKKQITKHLHVPKVCDTCMRFEV